MPSTRPISVSLTPELIDTLKATAERDGIKLSRLIEDLLWRSKTVRDMAASIEVDRRERAPMGRPPIQ